MKLTYYIEAANRISIRNYEGIVNKKMIIDSLYMFWANPNYNHKQHHLIDFSKTNLDLERADVIEIVENIETNVSIRDRMVSFVVAKPQEAAITMMYKELTQRKHITEVFVTKSEALEFIGAPSDFYKMLESKDAVVIEL